MKKLFIYMLIGTALISNSAVRAENLIAFTSVGKPFTGQKQLLANGHAAHVFMINGLSTLISRMNEVGKTMAGKSEAEQQALIQKIQPIVGTKEFSEIAKLEMRGRIYHRSLGLKRIPAVVINRGNTNYVVYGETDLVKAYNMLFLQQQGRAPEKAN